MSKVLRVLEHNQHLPCQLFVLCVQESNSRHGYQEGRAHSSKARNFDTAKGASVSDRECYRRSVGMTNLRAVWVGEKPTTLTSFKPNFRPAASTLFSVICF